MEAVPSTEQLRPTTIAMVGGGGLLLILAQWTTSAIPPDQRPQLYLLVLLGSAFFLLGGRAVMRQEFPHYLARPLNWLTNYLDVLHWQVILLVLAPCFAWLAHLAAGDFLLARRLEVVVAAWLLSIGFAIAGVMPTNDEQTTTLPRPSRLDLILSLGLLLLAFALRSFDTTHIPSTFSGDEGSAALSSVQFLNGEANNPFTIGWFSFPSLFFALQSIGIAIDGQTIPAVRLFSALGGALTVFALFWLGRTMFNRLTGFLAAAYLAASHYHIHMSRIALNNIWDGFFATIAIAGLWYGWKTGRRVGFVVCGLALGFGQYFYIAIRIVPLLFLVWAAVAFWRQRETFRQRLPGLVVAGYTAAIVFLPLALFFIAHPDEYRAPLNRVSVMGGWMANEMAVTGNSEAKILFDQMIAGILGFTHEPLRLLYNPGSPLLLTAAATLFLLGIMWSVINFDLRYLLLWLPLVAAVISNIFSQDSPASQRYIMAMPMVALLIAVPLVELVGWLRQLWPRVWRMAVAGAVVVVALLMVIDLRYYFFEIQDSYVLGGVNTQVATEVATYLRDNSDPSQDVYFFGFPRMGYYSFSTVPYLAPQMHGEEVLEPLTAPPSQMLQRSSIFIFLPERLNEFDYVRSTFPRGTYREFHASDGSILFAAYEVKIEG